MNKEDIMVYDSENDEFGHCKDARCQYCTKFQLELCLGYDAIPYQSIF